MKKQDLCRLISGKNLEKALMVVIAVMPAAGI